MEDLFHLKLEFSFSLLYRKKKKKILERLFQNKLLKKYQLHNLEVSRKLILFKVEYFR